jgi:hypothetical protein
LLAFLQYEGDGKVNLVGHDLVVLDHDVHVLDPRALDVTQGAGRPLDALVDGASKLSSDVALNSITRATLGIGFPLLRAALLLLRL